MSDCSRASTATPQASVIHRRNSRYVRSCNTRLKVVKSEKPHLRALERERLTGEMADMNGIMQALANTGGITISVLHVLPCGSLMSCQIPVHSRDDGIDLKETLLGFARRSKERLRSKRDRIDAAMAHKEKQG